MLTHVVLMRFTDPDDAHRARDLLEGLRGRVDAIRRITVDLDLSVSPGAPAAPPPQFHLRMTTEHDSADELRSYQNHEAHRKVADWLRPRLAERAVVDTLDNPAPTPLPPPDVPLAHGISGFGGRIGPGRAPAVLVIDPAMAYLTEGAPLRAPVEEALAAASELVAAARKTRVPVIFTRVLLSPGGADGGLFRIKSPGLAGFEAGDPLGDFAPDPAPRPDELVVTKQYASAFFGTTLASTLRTQGLDTLLICGLTTSGCVRATATDAMQHGFRPLVVAEACGDRDPDIHRANLKDIDTKCGDVVNLAWSLTHLGRLDPDSR